MGFNLIGASVATVTGAIVGFYGSFRLKKRAKKLTTCILLLSTFMADVRFSNYTVREMLTRCSSNAQFSSLLFLKKLSECSDGEIKKMWQIAIKEESELSDDDKEALLGVGNALGTTDKEGQLLCLEQFSELLKHQLEQANDEYLTKGRMYRSVGLLGGIAAGIVIV